MTLSFVEEFPALSAIEGLTHGFILRNPEIDVKTDRETAVDRLTEHYHDVVTTLGIPVDCLATGEQVHGNHVTVCSGGEFPSDRKFSETDGLVTNVPGQYLGVYVADCGAVFVIDPVRRACGVVHSGKKGTELGIAPEAIRKMVENFGSDPQDIIVQLAPCIRPPEYEIDFAGQIVKDCIEAGVPRDQVVDCGVCTTSDPERYYSYRKEKGKTGRLFAVIGWRIS